MCCQRRKPHPTFGVVAADFSYSEAPWVGGTQGQYPAHHAIKCTSRSFLGSPERLAEGRGQLCFPLFQPRAPGAHVGRVFVTTSFKVNALSDRLRRCEPPPSLTVFRGRKFFVGRLAQLCFRHTVLAGLAQCFESSCSSSKHRVLALADFAPRSRFPNAGVRRDGGGSHRLASPGREQLSSRCRVNDGGCDPHTQQR